MSSSWGDILRRVHITPGAKGPTLECRQTYLLDKWQEQHDSHSPSNPLPSPSQHLCRRDKILAQHDAELFQRADTASHVYDGTAQDEQEQPDSSACALCKLRLELPSHKSGNRGLYVVNLLNDKERQLALDYPPEHFIMGLAVSEENRFRLMRERLGNFPPPMEGIRKEELLVPIDVGDVTAVILSRCPKVCSASEHMG